MTRSFLCISALAVGFSGCRFAPAQMQSFDIESEFLAEIATNGWVAESEDFDGPAWDGVRSNYPTMNTAVSVTNLGVMWHGRPGNHITTNENWARTAFGIYEVQNVGFSSSVLTGDATGVLYGVGIWVNTNPDGGDVYIEIDGVPSEAVKVGSGHVFVGVTEPAGFSTFRIIDSEGETVYGMDDVTFARLLPSCPEDVTGDGAVDGGDLATLLAFWGTADSGTDLSGDGVVDGADLAQLLAAWGPCPG